MFHCRTATEMNDQRYAYYAFISYSHKDQKWADWLHRKLENYRLPNAVRREAEGRLPKHIRPVFRDKTDIGVGSLSQSLRKELEDSRFLIVICSPNSANSEWVSREIDHFRQMGRGERIIPFIVEGHPHAGEPSRECYPSALRESGDELLGVSVPELKQEPALVKVVAAILGLKFDQLWQRHKRRERQRTLCLAAALCTLCFMTLGGLALLWDYNREKTAYYTDYVEEWGIPKGIGRLSKETVRHREYSWQIVSQHRKAKSLTRVNSAGKPRESEFAADMDRPVCMRYFYRETGKLSHAEEYYAHGRLLRVWDYSDDLHYVWFKATKRGGIAASSYARTRVKNVDMIPEMGEEEKKSAIVGWELSYDAQGRIVQKLYLNRREEPALDAEGIAGIAYDYDDRGQVRKMTFVGIDRKPTSICCGAASQVFQYTTEGYRQATAWLDEESAPSLNPDGWGRAEFRFDPWGNETHCAFFGEDGAPCVDATLGVAAWNAQFDERGNRTISAYIGADGNPCFTKDGYSIQKRQFDEYGNEIGCGFFAADGSPCLHKEGCSSVKCLFDERGNNIGGALFDTDGKRCLNTHGISAWRVKYDERGNRTEIAHFGTDDKPCLNCEGFSISKEKHDERGNTTELAFFGTDGKLCRHTDGNAGWRRRYDERGNEIEYTLFGTDGKPCLTKWKFASFRRQYDEQGNVIEWAYFDLEGKPCLTWGYATNKMKYDDRGNKVEITYFGPDGKPCCMQDGFASWRAAYDRNGRLIEKAYFGIDGKPCLTKWGYAVVKTKYDECGKKSETRFDVDGKPCSNKK